MNVLELFRGCITNFNGREKRKGGESVAFNLTGGMDSVYERKQDPTTRLEAEAKEVNWCSFGGTLI